uniref:VP2 n=1 Tax=Equine encephalosis virus 2 TaxID=201497 RepID=A0A7U1BC65_9REOV|nr:VP2 [Equine encephalosis virus 2]
MDFRVLICSDIAGSSSLTDGDLDTYEDETTIIIRVNNQNLIRINEHVQQHQEVDLVGRGLKESGGAYNTNIWPKGTTSFDLFEPTVSISEVLKKTRLDRETTTSQMTSITYGKLVKEAKLTRDKTKARFGMVRGYYTELSRAEEQYARMCNANQHRDICSRDIVRLTGNRVKISTLIGEINLPGWLESNYSLVRESDHLDICGWSRSSFDFYRMGCIYIYETFKYIRTDILAETVLQSASQEARNVVLQLLDGKFERARLESLRGLSIVPRCVGGNDYSVPEGVLYGYLATYMKLLEVSSTKFLESERTKIVNVVNSHTRSEDQTFERFRATGRSSMLQSINKILNLRDLLLGVSRSHREMSKFYFSTDSDSYADWKRERGPRGFTASAYAKWIMKKDSEMLEEHLTSKVNFANYLRHWKTIAREMRFPVVYGRMGKRIRGAPLDVHFSGVYEWFSNNVKVLIHRGRDEEMFSKLIELTLRTAYSGEIPRCNKSSLVSFLKVLSFCMTGMSLDDQFKEVRVNVEEDDAAGYYWECRQDFTVPTRWGVTLAQASLEGCKEYYHALVDDPEFEAASEREVLKGESEDVHSLFPKEEITGRWINVPRFVGYSYRLYQGVRAESPQTTVGFSEVLVSPQSQYFRHQVVVTGGCRVVRDRFTDRTFSNKLRLPTPMEREGNYPCLVSKLSKSADRGVGSAVAFFFGRLFKYEILLVELVQVILKEPNRFPEEFVDALQRRYPTYRTELMECLQIWRTRKMLRLREELQLMLMSPGNWSALDFTLDKALSVFFEITTSIGSMYDTLHAVIDKAEFYCHVSPILRSTGRTRDFFSWNVMVFLTTLFAPEFLEYPKTVPIFVATARDIVAIPVKMKDYSMGGVAMNMLRYFDALVPQSIDRELSGDESKLLRSLRSVYLGKPISAGGMMEGTYSPFQSWVGLGCMGLKEKIEILVPTSKPMQSHFLISFSSEGVKESDATTVQSVLDENRGLGKLDVVVDRDGAIAVTDNLPKVKRYKHLAHNEMLDGCIIRLDTASRFDTYMAAKILN